MCCWCAGAALCGAHNIDLREEQEAQGSQDATASSRPMDAGGRPAHMMLVPMVSIDPVRSDPVDRRLTQHFIPYAMPVEPRSMPDAMPGGVALITDESCRITVIRA
jgi:hypothetical protein